MSDSIFTKNKEKNIYENDSFFVLKDIKPQAKIHYLIIPKIEYENFIDFIQKSKIKEQNDLFKTVKDITKDLKSFQFLTRNGVEAGQEIFHLHFHILSNE